MGRVYGDIFSLNNCGGAKVLLNLATHSGQLKLIVYKYIARLRFIFAHPQSKVYQIFCLSFFFIYVVEWGPRIMKEVGDGVMAGGRTAGPWPWPQADPCVWPHPGDGVIGVCIAADYWLPVVCGSPASPHLVAEVTYKTARQATCICGSSIVTWKGRTTTLVQWMTHKYK